MVSLLFWNASRRDLTNRVSHLCNEYDIDLIVLAESPVSDIAALEAINRGRSPAYIAPFNPSDWLKFYVRGDCRLSLLRDERRVAIRRFQSSVGNPITVVAAHLPSKLYDHDLDQYEEARRLSAAVQEVEASEGHDRTILIGDLNMNPFDIGVAAAKGLHAVMAKDIAADAHRTVGGVPSKFFYNPMWSRMGDGSVGPPGTYYYRDSRELCYFWNMFDQVLLRPSLIPSFRSDRLVVIDTISEQPLIRDGRIDTSISDHLPVYVELELADGADE
jgi:endonuclease/exonuclease/phosphatase family metal-dependent hydrolase